MNYKQSLIIISALHNFYSGKCDNPYQGDDAQTFYDVYFQLNLLTVKQVF